ncbi:hypoxanthine phosphoribosyltransferase [Alkaliphilus serpentinus]|uniref:Hypoxanthine phosphoribosyltransferase n=1 Tax=Alkaliphilus serpentinus TaxID=1482731 RepID=A0A833HRG3_9FIRM|nr:hypoxanthine phosphoribosyltransferase [Alkaliphilus serpentinus]KAB3533212.1 hypoxanthine phosphoribosyltransferase [Alkaliphilus serpentinus]
MYKENIEVMISKEEIAHKVKALGEEITNDYSGSGKELVVIGVLKGANVFLGDLIRQIDLPILVDFIAVSSYGLSTETSGVVKILKDLDLDVEGKDVLIIEDIVDTGLTLKYLTENFKSRNIASMKICALLDKPERRKCPIDIDYLGFEIPDKFVVGYGIDYAEKYRNLPYVAVVKS